METKVQRDEEIEIDLLELFQYLWKRIFYIIGAGGALAMVAIAVTVFLMTPKYTSVTKMYVLNRQATDSITNSDLQSSSYLTEDYMELIKSRTVIETVIADLGLPRSYESLLESIEVSAQSDTRVVSIKVTDEDPYLARDIANSVRIVAAARIQEVMNIEAVNVVDEANIPTQKSGPSLKKNTLIGGFAGVFLVVAWLVILYLLDDKIVSAEDVERYLELGILGQMPLDEEEMTEKAKRKKRKKNLRTLSIAKGA